MPTVYRQRRRTKQHWSITVIFGAILILILYAIFTSPSVEAERANKSQQFEQLYGADFVEDDGRKFVPGQAMVTGPYGDKQADGSFSPSSTAPILLIIDDFNATDTKDVEMDDASRSALNRMLSFRAEASPFLIRNQESANAWSYTFLVSAALLLSFVGIKREVYNWLAWDEQHCQEELAYDIVYSTYGSFNTNNDDEAIAAWSGDCMDRFDV
jgi:hypothetical protein